MENDIKQWEELTDKEKIALMKIDIDNIRQGQKLLTEHRHLSDGTVAFPTKFIM